MKHVINKKSSWATVFDASILDDPGPDYFDVGFWRSREAVKGEAAGRGSAWFIDTPHGAVVLRNYLRGGWAAAISRQRYFFTGISNSRPFREYHVLAELYERGLPVPRPVAALCQHHGVISTGAIMTASITPSRTLADSFSDGGLLEGAWTKVGACIRKFHDAGVWHADLNARNILLSADQAVYLIDFDRARLTPGKPIDGEGNLKRLKRSLNKLWQTDEIPALQQAWTELKAGYDK